MLKLAIEYVSSSYRCLHKYVYNLQFLQEPHKLLWSVFHSNGIYYIIISFI